MEKGHLLKKIFGNRISLLIIVALLIIILGLTFVLINNKSNNLNSSKVKNLMTNIETAVQNQDANTVSINMEEFICSYIVKDYFETAKKSEMNENYRIKDYKINSCSYYGSPEQTGDPSYGMHVKVDFEVEPVNLDNSNWNPNINYGSGTINGNIINDTTYIHVSFNDLYRNGHYMPELFTIDGVNSAMEPLPPTTY